MAAAVSSSFYRSCIRIQVIGVLGNNQARSDYFLYYIFNIIRDTSGSRSGGYATDKWGLHRVLITGLGLNGIALILIAIGIHVPVMLITMLILWSIVVWSLGPPQQLHVITIAPESTGIILSLNSMVLQLAMAAGAGVGGLLVEGGSLSLVPWIAAAAIAVAFGAVHLSRRMRGQ